MLPIATLVQKLLRRVEDYTLRLPQTRHPKLIPKHLAAMTIKAITKESLKERFIRSLQCTEISSQQALPHFKALQIWRNYFQTAEHKSSNTEQFSCWPKRKLMQ